MNKHSTLINMHTRIVQKTYKSTTYFEIQKKDHVMMGGRQDG